MEYIGQVSFIHRASLPSFETFSERKEAPSDPGSLGRLTDIK